MKTLILDCDGTVYQDLEFDLVYFEYILRNDNRFSLKHLHELTELIMQGEILKMNTNVIVPKQKANTIMELTDMLSHLKEANINMEHDPELLYLGDLWSILSLISRCIDIDPSIASEAFYHTRKWQLKRLTVNQSLNDAIRKCRDVMQVCLLTNSPEDTAREFIEKLGLIDAFSTIFYDCHKPYGLKKILSSYKPELLSDMTDVTIIGDHYYNDLHLFRNSGAHIIWMNPYPKVNRPERIHELNTLQELTAYLNCLAQI